MTQKFKLGFLTHVTDHEDPATSYRNLIELFTAAEDLGYDGGWIAQHHDPAAGRASSPLVLLSAIAARTSRIELGTGVVVLPFEDPIRLAEDAAVLDEISHHRVQLGLGSGGANGAYFEIFGAGWEDKSASFIDRQQYLQSLLDGQPLKGGDNLRLSPPARSLGDRLWHSHATQAGAIYAGRQGNGLLLGTAVHHPLKVQKPLADAYLEAWDQHSGTPRIGVIRALFPAASKQHALAELATDLAPFGDWLRREGLAEGDLTPAQIAAHLNVHHGTPAEVIASLTADPALFDYATYFVPVVQSKSSTLAAAIERLAIIAREIAPAFGWRPAGENP